MKGWGKCYNVIINSAAALYDYQVGFNVQTVNGLTGNFVASSKRDLSDLRFTNERDQLLPYWIRNDGGGYPSSPNGKVITPWAYVSQTTEVVDPYGGSRAVMKFAEGMLVVGSESTFNFLHAVGTTGKWSIQFPYKWQNRTATSRIITSAVDASNVGIEVYVDNSRYLVSRIECGVAENPLSIATSSTQLPDDSNWHVITITYDQSLASNNFKQFCDGVLIGTGTKSAQTPSTSNASFALTIGARPLTCLLPFNGYLADIHILNGICIDGTIVPTEPPIPTANSALLIHGDNINAPLTFLDDSTGQYEVWVRVPSLLASSNNIIRCYSIADVDGTSDGFGTFLLFDNFDNSWDTRCWAGTPGVGNFSIANNIASNVAPGASYYSWATKYLGTGVNISARARLKAGHLGNDSYDERFGFQDTIGYIYMYYSPTQGPTLVFYDGTTYDNSTIIANVGQSITQFFINELKILPSSVVFNGTSYTKAYSRRNSNVLIITHNAGSAIYTDWIMIKRATTTEPSVTSIVEIALPGTEITGNYKQFPGGA